LRVIAQPGGNYGNSIGKGQEAVGTDIEANIGDDWNDTGVADDAAANANAKNKGSNLWLYGLALAMAGAGIFFMFHRRKK
jgi:hypothetical protein